VRRGRALPGTPDDLAVHRDRDEGGRFRLHTSDGRRSQLRPRREDAMILLEEFGAVVVMVRGNGHPVVRPVGVLVVVPGQSCGENREDGNLSGCDCGAEPPCGHHGGV
jgi:hypothetical protein